MEQANLILDIVPEFSREQLTFEHESISADAPEFREGETYDLVLSMGLLYHLPNPLQHLHNLARLTKEVLILHTLIHREQPNTWKLVAEDAAFITKSFQGVSWIGHYMEVERWLKAAGFARVESLVPPGLENLADMFQLKTISTPASYADRLMRRAGVKPSIESYVKLQNFLVHNPYYFTYIAYRH